MEECGVIRVGKGGSVKIDYRPVHEFTLTDDIDYIKPKKRVY
jgi:succinate dehydrogenase / fumarate reductase, flavoprotein subunit